MKSTSIVMLTHGFYPDIGGLEIAVQNFAQVLVKHGHTVHVLVPIKTGLAENEVLNGIFIHRFPFDWVAAEAALLQNIGVPEFRSRVVRDIQSIFNEIGQPSIIHAHGEAIVAGAWLKAQNNRLKLVYTPHASPAGLKELYHAKIFGQHFRPALGKTDIIAYQLMSHISALKDIIKPTKIRRIVNFIDTLLFDPSKYETDISRQALNLPKTAKILFSPSRIDEEKGLIELVSALPMVLKTNSDTTLYIAGDLNQGFMIDPGLVQRKIIRKVRKVLPNNFEHVYFTGAIPYHQMPEWYSASDVIVLISKDECLPMCLLEAMAMKKPIVATNVGGIPELLENTPGRLVEMNGQVSVEAIATALIEQLTLPPSQLQLLQKFREKILNHYSPEVGYQELKNIYSELLD